MSDMERFKKLKVKRTSDLAVEAIWDLIHSGELHPGEKLPPEKELAKRFGISMTSLREALQKLESYGHITKKWGKGGGSIVLDVTENPGLEIAAKKLMLQRFTIENINEAISVFGQLIYKIAMERISDEEILKLKKLCEQQRKEFQTHNGSVLGWKFSIEVSKTLNNPVLASMLEYLMLLLMQKEFSLGIDDIGSTDQVIEYNRKAVDFTETIVEAFETKNPKLIEQATTMMNNQLLLFSEFE